MTLSETYDILISLVLPNIYADWNIESSIELIEKWASTYSPVANFTITSQIIYHPVQVLMSHDYSGLQGSTR